MSLKVSYIIDKQSGAITFYQGIGYLHASKEVGVILSDSEKPTQGYDMMFDNHMYNTHYHRHYVRQDKMLDDISKYFMVQPYIIKELFDKANSTIDAWKRYKRIRKNFSIGAIRYREYVREMMDTLFKHKGLDIKVNKRHLNICRMIKEFEDEARVLGDRIDELEARLKAKADG